MPNGQLTDIRFYKPRKKTNTNKAISKTDNSIKSKAESKIISFRFSTQADWLGLPSSYIRIDSQSSELISLKQFKQLSTGEKIMSVIKPLHTGRGLHWGYVLVLLLMSALGVLMVFSGLASFVMKRRAWLRFNFNFYFIKRYL